MSRAPRCSWPRRCVPAGWARWGATDAEVFAELPGDEFVLHADRTTARAVTVHAAPDAVWPWIAQLGQARWLTAAPGAWRSMSAPNGRCHK